MNDIKNHPDFFSLIYFFRQSFATFSRLHICFCRPISQAINLFINLSSNIYLHLRKISTNKSFLIYNHYFGHVFTNLSIYEISLDDIFYIRNLFPHKIIISRILNLSPNPPIAIFLSQRFRILKFT